ncbi:MAG: thioredoxin family protein [Gemmatimonadetes bacterium]|nr:thioredoxin family protein [Gemmatimonadota bacterium]
MNAERYASAVPLVDYIETTRKNTEFWRGVQRTARIPDDLAEQAAAISGTVHLLALSEDWCGDAVNTLPIVARLVELIPGATLRILGRDANPDLMNAHLTAGTRSIPVVIAYDADFRELGWWGPRPTELQRLHVSELRTLPKDERNLRVRTWYARDRGRSTAAEVLALIQSGLAEPSTPAPSDR